MAELYYGGDLLVQGGVENFLNSLIIGSSDEDSNSNASYSSSNESSQSRSSRSTQSLDAIDKAMYVDKDVDLAGEFSSDDSTDDDTKDKTEPKNKNNINDESSSEDSSEEESGKIFGKLSNKKSTKNSTKKSTKKSTNKDKKGGYIRHGVNKHSIVPNNFLALETGGGKVSNIIITDEQLKPSVEERISEKTINTFGNTVDKSNVYLDTTELFGELISQHSSSSSSKPNSPHSPKSQHSSSSSSKPNSPHSPVSPDTNEIFGNMIIDVVEEKPTVVDKKLHHEKEKMGKILSRDNNVKEPSDLDNAVDSDVDSDIIDNHDKKFGHALSSYVKV